MAKSYDIYTITRKGSVSKKATGLTLANARKITKALRLATPSIKNVIIGFVPSGRKVTKSTPLCSHKTPSKFCK